MSLLDNIWAFAKVFDDVIFKNRQGRAVILFPRSSTSVSGSSQDPGWSQIYAIMQDLIAVDVIIVTCAGDESRRASKPDNAPAAWASRSFPIVVAGAVTNVGDYARFSQGVSISQDIAWAPGDGVACASSVASQDQKGQGTAFAAGMVRAIFSSGRIKAEPSLIFGSIGCRSRCLPSQRT